MFTLAKTSTSKDEIETTLSEESWTPHVNTTLIPYQESINQLLFNTEVTVLGESVVLGSERKRRYLGTASYMEFFSSGC